MSDIDNDLQIDEITLLKKRADSLGIAYSPNIGVDTLRKRIEDHLSAGSTPPDETASTAESTVKTISVAQYAKMELMKLVRVRVTCMNPASANLSGEVITVGNNFIGSIRKFVPFNSAEPTHIPKCVLDVLREKKHIQIKSTKDARGRTTNTTSLVNSYAIEELPPLTEAELKELAKLQQAAGLNNED